MVEKKASKLERFTALEGVRGLAAIVVVIFHSLYLFYPQIIYGINTQMAATQHMRFEEDLHGSIIGASFSGILAVSIFFVLSGFVLTVGFLQKKDPAILRRQAVKRYVRLMPPALAVIILCYLVLKFNLDQHIQSVAVSGSTHMLHQWDMAPDIFKAIKQAVWGIFTSGSVSYNPVLWTMQYEFMGAFLVFAIALLFGSSRYRWLIYGVVLLGVFNTWYLGFVLGLILADLHTSGYLEKINKKMLLVGLGGALLIGGYPPVAVEGTIYEHIYITSLGTHNLSFYTGIAAFVILLSILRFESLSRFFSHRYIAALGKYTYSLYLTHKLILLTVMAGSFVYFSSKMGYNQAVLLSVVISLPLIVLLTVGFERFVDRPTVVFSRKFVQWLEEGRATDSLKKVQQSYKKLLRKTKRKAARLFPRPTAEPDEEF